jgi:hypothetical protein
VSLQHLEDDNVALVDLVDRLIDGGVVVTGDIVLSLAGVDLVYLGLRLVLAPAHKVSIAGIGEAKR